MRQLTYINEQGAFTLRSAQRYGEVYFPLVNEGGMISSVTPLLAGDCKSGQNTFLLAPASEASLRSGRDSRNFWVRFNGGRPWSVTGQSAPQQAQRFDPDCEETVLTGGLLWQRVTRENRALGLRSSVLSFVPAGREKIEIMQVTLTNTGGSPLELSPTAAVPLYARSADNIRDHRHVTSLLHRVELRRHGPDLTPTLTFDERGHRPGQVTYRVWGGDETGAPPQGFLVLAKDFVGEGSWDWPEAVVCPRPEIWLHAGQSAQGGEMVAALFFLTVSLGPGESRRYQIVLAIDDNPTPYLTLIEKLLLLCAVKTVTLDAAGMGIEMEGGKPGWYDALNGLPGLLGSSMAESCELARLLAFTRRALEQKPGQVELYGEIAELAERVAEVLAGEPDPFRRWDRLNEAKERCRAGTNLGFSGARRGVSRAALAGMLGQMEEAVRSGIRAAVALGGGICPTYFTFTADGVKDTPEGPMPIGLTPHMLPLFLEGPVHWLKLAAPQAEKAALARRVRESGLYDQKLNMYKVNESLSGVSLEAGRAVAFSPGWLENESIWLHMEYKYFLELLKSGLYEEFAQAFHAAAVPFLDPERYGRSPLENVSFLASSANPDPERWGRGYVARLSGSTAEFLQMWQILFFGPSPFRREGGELRLVLEPFLPGYLMLEDGVVRAAFLGDVQVTYRAPGCAALVPGKTAPVRWTLTGRDGRRTVLGGPYLPVPEARAVRAGEIAAMEIEMEESR